MNDDFLSATLPQYSVPAPQVGATKYQQLLSVIDELGKDIRPTYTGNKICAERLKRSIVHARILVRECLLEAEKDRQKAASEALANANKAPLPSSSASAAAPSNSNSTPTPGPSTSQ